MHHASGFSHAEHPQISLMRGLATCPLGGQPFTTDCYFLFFKKLKSGVVLYGRTQYDHSNGTMSFIKPRQIIQFKNLELEEDNFIIAIHEDFLNGYPLHNDIQNYHYFDYETNEALHLSPREEAIIWDLYTKMEGEYYNNPDEYSRDIILAHLDAILKYSQRFYKRQFIHRTQLSGNTVSKFNGALASYSRDGLLETKGLPSVHQMAAGLNLSPRYLSDLLKQETGKTAIELIHIYLINEAKNRLTHQEQNVSEIAYSLGFENLPYFSRLFKKEVGLSPVEFKKQLAN